MDQTQFANLKIEINGLATFISDYTSNVSDYLGGSTPTCVHFLNTINNLKNDTATSIAFDRAWSGHGSSYGALSDFIFEVTAIQRSVPILTATKATYYTDNDTQKTLEKEYNKGEVARTISYIVGISPDQKVII